MLKMMIADCKTDRLDTNPPATIAAMDARYSYSSTRNSLSALMKTYPECKAFRTEFDKRRKEWSKIDTSQVPTATQEKKFVAWDDLLAWRDAHFDTLSHEEQLLISLYTMIAPQRADYTPMMIVTRKPRKLADDTNYLLVGKGSMSFLFHAYKTSTTYGDRKLAVPARLRRVLTSWIDAHPGQTYLFEDAGQPWTDQRLGTAVRKIFQKYHQMDTGISTLRHSYLTYTHKGAAPLSDLTKLSNKMAHSITTSFAYRHISLE